MDSKGRVMLPIGLRYKLDINEEDVLAVDQLEDGTIPRKKVDVPIHRRIETGPTRVRIGV
jgi:bifunctional DNA-binding transcriptional regulator/antitoxin component of YhaV-PrlF toxin-antitoxin module